MNFGNSMSKMMTLNKCQYTSQSSTQCGIWQPFCSNNIKGVRFIYFLFATAFTRSSKNGKRIIMKRCSTLYPTLSFFQMYSHVRRMKQVCMQLFSDTATLKDLVRLILILAMVLLRTFFQHFKKLEIEGRQPNWLHFI